MSMEADQATEYGSPSYVRIKCGDFEFEMRKSIQGFVKSFKNSRYNKNKFIQKAIRNLKIRINKKTDKDVAEELLKSWDTYKEDLFQIMHGISKKGK